LFYLVIGQVHVSELALERITDPKPLFSPGDRMDVKLLEVWKLLTPRNPQVKGIYV
jgi:ribosomal protein S1